MSYVANEIVSYLIPFIYNIIILINLTLIAGILPFIERKYLALIQRRVGPTFVGYKGRLQFIADALKMFLKGCLIPDRLNSVLFFIYPASVLAICYLFWLNILWAPDLMFFELEYNVVYVNILSSLINFFIILTGIYSLNKYATIAAIRSIVMFFCLELLLGLFLLNVVIYSNSFSFCFITDIQEEIPLITVFFFGISSIAVVTLMEVNRSPFDLSEAESELIAGFHVEYGSFFFGLYYLAEYFHLFFFSIILVTLLIGF